MLTLNIIRFDRPTDMDVDDDNKSNESQEASKENAVAKKPAKKDLVCIV